MVDAGDPRKGEQPSRWFASETVIVAVITALVAAIGGSYATSENAAGKNRELDIKLVEIGIGILRADPKDEKMASIRRWAIEIIERNSRVPFSENEKTELLNKKITGLEELNQQMMMMMTLMQADQDRRAQKRIDTPTNRAR